MTKSLFSKLMAAILACAMLTLVLFSCSMTANADGLKENGRELRGKNAVMQQIFTQGESSIRSQTSNFPNEWNPYPFSWHLQ